MPTIQTIALICILAGLSVLPIIVFQNIRSDREEDEKELKRENSTEKNLYDL